MVGRFKVGDIVERTLYRIEGSCLHVGCKLEILEIVKRNENTFYRCKVLEGVEKSRIFIMIPEKIKDIKKNNLRW